MRRRLAVIATALVLGASAAAQAATTIYTDPESLFMKWYNAGVEQTVGKNLSLGANAEFFQDTQWLVIDANMNLRLYVNSNDGGLYLQGTVMELSQEPKGGTRTLTTSFQAGAGYKWVDETGLTADLRIWTPLKKPHAYIGVGIGYTW